MSSTNREPEILGPSLRPTCYDRVASLVISMLILTGSSVAVLVVVWLGAPQEIARVLPPVGFGDQAGDKTDAETTDLETPSLSELSQIAISEPITELSQLLTPDAVAAASMIDLVGTPSETRPIGEPSPPDEVPRWERWEIRYDASSIASYAQQLDFFQIELGAAGGKKHVDYAARLSDASPKTRTAPGDAEQRLYFAWRGGTLQAMDRKLLQRAGVDVEGRIVLQFYPHEVDDLLARLERVHAEGGRVDKLHKTIFGVRRTTDGYEYYIIEQR